METSARNALRGTVVSLAPGAVNTPVAIDIGAGERVVASITRDSVERLGLAEGRAATALVKATSVIVTTARDNPTSACNFLPGAAREVNRGAVNSVVVLDVAGGQTLTATITNDSVDRLGLVAGSSAAGLVKASSVIVAAEG